MFTGPMFGTNVGTVEMVDGCEVPVSLPPNYTNSAKSVDPNIYDNLDDLGSLLVNNREWAEEQAQKQMDFQTSANKAAMEFSHDEAEIQRNWLENMSNSSFQRAVKDLKAAGLNPILAYSQGGASVPSVSAASGVTSAGSKASTSDTGYDFYDILYKLYATNANNATDIATAIIGGLFGLASKTSVVTKK